MELHLSARPHLTRKLNRADFGFYLATATIPNTSVQAAAEGLPAINPRKALIVTGASLGASLAVLAASTIKAPAASEIISLSRNIVRQGSCWRSVDRRGETGKK